jgi:histone deacetylase complex regulatory component SIN3
MKIPYKNYPSKYELQYVKWNGIQFDKEKLIEFIKRLKLTYFLSFIPSYREEHNMLKDILNLYDRVSINGLLNNDEIISRMCFIEKWARIAATDLLLANVYSRTTYTTISNLPYVDYQLLMKRTEELISLGQNITYQKDNITDNIPGT